MNQKSKDSKIIAMRLLAHFLADIKMKLKLNLLHIVWDFAMSIEGF